MSEFPITRLSGPAVAQFLGRVVRNTQSIIIVLLTMAMVFGTLHFSQLETSVHHAATLSLRGLLSDIPRWLFVNLLQVAHQNPVVAVLQGVNLATALYAFVYYLMLNEIVLWQKWVIAVLLLTINYVGYHQSDVAAELAKAGFQSDADTASLKGSYLVSALYLIVFALFDGFLHFTRNTSERGWYYGFSCLYVQIPALASLGVAFWLQGTLRDYGTNTTESVAFLAGVSAATMFLSNLVLAVMDSPWYFKSRIRVSCP